ncbi:MFS transporter [Arthrobacter sp. SDTb3-6]|nr:MFS transporter [Arthrobacter sp. SDTb3-6]
MDRLPIGRLHRKVVIAVGLGLFFDMYEVFLSGSMGAALKDFSVSGLQLKLLLASAFVGMFFGAAFLGSLADRFGRRKAFLFNLLWYSAWSLIGAFSPNVWFLVIARFMAGIGVGAEYPVADAYLSDTMPKDKRGRMASWAYTCSYVAIPVVGFMALWLNQSRPMDISGWRWLMAFGALGALVVLFLRRGLPESPRWLLTKGRSKEAQTALEAFAAGSGVEVTQICDDPSPTNTQTKSSLEILRKAPYNKRLAMLAIFHVFQTFGYYGFGTLAALVLVARGYSVTSSLLFVALSFLGYPIGSLLSTPLIIRFERKYLLMGSLIALAASGLAFATSTAPLAIIAFGFITTLISNIFSNVYHIYQAEIFPTAVRATAVGWTYSLSRLSSGALPFILLPILDAFGALPMFSMVGGALLIICITIGLLGPKTTRRSVDDINPA